MFFLFKINSQISQISQISVKFKPTIACDFCNEVFENKESNLFTSHLCNHIDNIQITENTQFFIVDGANMRVSEQILHLLRELKYNVNVISQLTPNDIYNKNDVYIIFNTNQTKLPINSITYDIPNSISLIKWYTDKTQYQYRKKNAFYVIPDLYFLQRNILALSKNPHNIKISYDIQDNVIYCLNLMECDRLTRFLTQSNLPVKHKFEIYPGIKYHDGIKGCAFSYLNIIYNAKRCNLKQITICEDDCLFPNNFDDKYTVMCEFLQIVEWDILVGVIANIPQDVILSKIYKYKGLTFLEVNRMHSTVFNIYNNTSYDKILNCWKEGHIDGFFSSLNLKLIIPFPFEFACLDEDSTIQYENKNLFNEYNLFFEASSKLLSSLIENYEGDIIVVVPH